MGDDALDRLYETLTDLQAGDVDAFRGRVIVTFRQLVELFREQQKRTRNQAQKIIIMEQEVGELKKRLKSLVELIENG